MTKTIHTLVATLLAILLLASCWSKPKDSDVSTFYVVKMDGDATIYGICAQVASDSIFLISDVGDSLWLSLDGAKVCGTPVPDCRMAVMLHPDGKVACSINVSALMGTWVEPDPIEEGFEMGISLLEGGDASSINSRVHDYRRWCFYNCQLLLMSQTDFGGGVGESVIDTFDILDLSPDSLVMKSGEFTFRYSHPNDTVVTHEYYDHEDTIDYQEFMF